MQIALSVLAALFYGAADFCGGMAAKRSSAITVAMTSRLASLLLLLALIPLVRSANDSSDYAWGAGAGLFGGVAIALLYRALAVGKMSVASTLTAVVAAIVPIVVSVLHGDQLTAFRWCGMAAALLAVLLVTGFFKVRAAVTLSGIWEALGSGFAIGISYVLLVHTHRQDGGMHNLLSARLASIAVLSVLAIQARTPLQPRAYSIVPAIAAGALDTAANALFILATFFGPLAVTAVLASMYPLSTMFLARISLRERLSKSQWWGCALALLGLFLIAEGR